MAYCPKCRAFIDYLILVETQSTKYRVRLPDNDYDEHEMFIDPFFRLALFLTGCLETTASYKCPKCGQELTTFGEEARKILTGDDWLKSKNISLNQG